VHVRNSGEQNSELIAAFSADGICQPNVFLKAFRGAYQEFITDVMTEPVVNLLKAVEIEKEDRDPIACAICFGCSSLEPLAEQSAIWQFRQRITVSEFRDRTMVQTHAQRPNPIGNVVAELFEERNFIAAEGVLLGRINGQHAVGPADAVIAAGVCSDRIIGQPAVVAVAAGERKIDVASRRSATRCVSAQSPPASA
jgi:hypothetical protein